MAEAGNADMLRVARQFRGMKQGDAAKRLGVTPAKLSRIERKRASFGDDLIEQAASAFDFLPTFFMQPDAVLGAHVGVHWRKKASVKVREMDQISAEACIRFMHLRKLTEVIEVKGTYPLPRLPIDDFNGNVERVAGLVRAQWWLPAGPIQNLTQAVEDCGVVVVHSLLAGSAVDGVAFSAQGLPPLIILNANQPGDHMRFTLAHELGHLVMHHNRPTQEMEQLEQQAEDFAGCLLMPGRDIRPHFTQRRINRRLLAKLWGVPMSALLMRVRSLRLLNNNHERFPRQWPELSISPETVSVPADLIDLQNGLFNYSIADVARLLHIKPHELQSLYGLPIEPEPEPAPAPKAPHLRVIK